MKHPIVFTLTLILAVLIQIPDATAQNALHLQSPHDYQVCQRSSPSEGTIVVEGRLSEPAQNIVIVEARVIGANLPDAWQKVATLPEEQVDFQAELSVPAGGWYQLDVRAKQQDTMIAEIKVGHVGVGEVFIIAGQSNSANHGGERLQTGSGMVTAFDGNKWQIANDPQPGASGGGGSFIPLFGDGMAKRFGVPIGIVSTGVGATSVREWLPRSTRFPNPPTLTGNVTELPNGEWESKGTVFEKFVARLKPLGPKGFRAVLWHQGESDANQRDSTRTLKSDLYREYLAQLIQDSRREVGWKFPWFVAQASYHTPDDPGSPDIRAAQKALWDAGVALEGPDTDALTGQLRDNDGKGVHFSGAGLRAHGASWVEKVAPWLEQGLKEHD